MSKEHADVMTVANDAAVAMLDEVKVYVKRQSSVRQALFFTSLMRVPVECMVAALGPPERAGHPGCGERTRPVAREKQAREQPYR